MKASKYNNKKHYKKQKTRKHNKKHIKKHNKKHHKKSRRKLKRNSKKPSYSRGRKLKGGKSFSFYNNDPTLGNIYPLSKTGTPVGGNEIYQRADPVYQVGQLKGGGSTIPLTGEVTNLFRSGIHSMNEIGRSAIGDSSPTNPYPTNDHFTHNGGNGAKINNTGMQYLDNALTASNSSTRNF